MPVATPYVTTRWLCANQYWPRLCDYALAMRCPIVYGAMYLLVSMSGTEMYDVLPAYTRCAMSVA
eukprot:739501-Rhodomonas_salina.1